MERKVQKKLAMLLRVLSSKKYRTAKRGKKLEKVEALAQKRIAETTPIIKAKLTELERADLEKQALIDLQDLCDHLGDYSKENIGARVLNLMTFFGVPLPGESPPRKKKAKKVAAEGAAPAAKPAKAAPAAKPAKVAPDAPKA